MSRPISTFSKLGSRIAGSGKTLIETSRDTQIHPVTMSRYVNLRSTIRANHLMALAEYLECEPEDLLGLVEDDD